ncbi:MAG: CoA ester lyase [Actinomycetota bacterium]|nr:CoA ester lyase [Actinomycetota bacterium]
MSARSFLYIPGDREEFLTKAFDRGADAIIADLEDGVAPAAKDAARKIVAGWIEQEPGAQTWVRLNSGALMEADVTAVCAPGLTGVVLPKASIDALASLDVLLTIAEKRADLAEGTVLVCPLIETAQGVLDVRLITEAPRVSHLAIGEVDLGAELNITDADAMNPIRMQLVVASAAAGISPPTAPVATDFQDLDALRSSTLRLKAMGFGARAAIHPAQVPPINEVFTPTTEEIEAARELVTTYDAALARGNGVIKDADGKMVDEAVVRSARRTLTRAKL